MGGVRDGVPGETCGSGRKQHVAGSFRPAKIAGQGNANNGSQTAPVQRISLNHDHRPSKTGTGTEPVGSGRFAQYTSPWATTIRRLQEFALPPLKWLDRVRCRWPRRLDSSPRLQLQDRGVRYTRLRLPCRPDFAISSIVGKAARLRRKPYRELKLRFSYRKYNDRPALMQTDRSERVQRATANDGLRDRRKFEAKIRSLITTAIFFALYAPVAAQQPNKVGQNPRTFPWSGPGTLSWGSI